MKLKYNGSCINDMNFNSPKLKTPTIQEVKDLLKDGEKLVTKNYTLFLLNGNGVVAQYTGGMRYQDYYSII